MKKIFAMVAVAAGLLFAGNANAQMGIHFGYSPESWANENSTTELSSIFVGVNQNIPLSGGLNALVGGQIRLGFESGESSFYGLASAKHSTTLIGVDVPILLNYGLNLTGDIKLTLFAGPKVSFGIMGKTKFEGNVVGIGGNGEADWYDGDGMNLNRFNLSGTFGLALGFQQFSLYGGYNYGLLDMDNNDNTKTTISGLFFGLSMGL